MFSFSGHDLEVAEEAHGPPAPLRDHGPGPDLRRRLHHPSRFQVNRHLLEEAGKKYLTMPVVAGDGRLAGLPNSPDAK